MDVSTPKNYVNEGEGVSSNVIAAEQIALEKKPSDTGVKEPQLQNAEPNVFANRDTVEILTLSDLGTDIEIEANYKGDKIIRVPRWSIRQTNTCTTAAAHIIRALYPNDLLFLLQIDFTKLASASSKIAKIISHDIHDPMLQIIIITLNIGFDMTDPTLPRKLPKPEYDDEVERFLNSITFPDTLNIFCLIMEQEINNERLETIIKKFQGLMGEKFRLQNASFGLQDLLTSAQQQKSSIS